MSHPFGDLLSQYLHRKHGLSQAKLAAGISQPAFVISLMCRGERLTGRRARARVLAIIEWLREQGAINEVNEAQDLLGAAGLPGLDPGLPDDARLLQTLQLTGPPATAAALTPPDLPATLSSFVGRTREIATVKGLLRANRLLTLTGAGGVGKTRLALEVAAAVRDDFADGVCFVSLAPIRDPGLVADAIARALNLWEIGGRRSVEGIQVHLRSKHMLLVLDNFEHVLSAAALVAQLLAAAPRLVAFVTSRAPLRLSGEQEFPVPPLARPTLHQPLALESLSQVEAVALFAQRTQAVRPDFQLSEANASTVAGICVRLDGLPLAIELAAARGKVLPLPVLLARLEQRLHLLTGGPRDLPPRQQTLRDTIAWSYDLLDPREQQLFRRLAVFVGGCTLQAVEAVCDREGDLQLDVLEGLAALLDNSLIEPRESVDGEPRFTMLETIREYALEQLEASGELEALRQRHAGYFVTLAEAAQPALWGAQQMTWLNRLEVEHPNIRAALAWSRTEASGETALRLSAAVGEFWIRRGHLSEGRGWLLDAMARSEAGLAGASPTRAQLTLRAEALRQAGVLASWQVDLAAAEQHFEEHLALCRELHDRRGIAGALGLIGMCFLIRGEPEQANSLLEQSMSMWRQLGEPGPYFFLGVVAWAQGNYGRAGGLLEEGLAVSRDRGNTWMVALTLGYLAMVNQEQGNHARARDHLAESLALLLDLGGRWGITLALEAVGVLTAAQGQRPEDVEPGGLHAARIFGAAEALRETLGAPMFPSYRDHYQRGLAAARAQLDAESFAAAWVEGRAMALEQAIAYALELTSSGSTPATNTGPITRMAPPASTRPWSPPSTAKAMPDTRPARAPTLLTARETEVLHLVARGLTNAEVADRLVISSRTVERHLSSIYRKLEVNSRTAAARYAIDHDLV